MTLRVSNRTLEQLEWPQLTARLAERTRTPGGRRRCAPEAERPLYAGDGDELRERLAETREARSILEAGERVPLGGVTELAPALDRARRGGILGAGDLLDLGSALRALDATQRFLQRFRENAPRLASRADALGEHGGLRDEIEASIDGEGAVRDAASTLLADARADARRLSGELQRKLESSLHDPAVAPYLSDSFVTVRNDRYVLPVRSDSRGRVRGIVHDASASGTTLFIEPEPVVDLNNRLKEAELRIDRETQRILRELSSHVQQESDAISSSLEGLEEIDLVFARAELSEHWAGVEPELADDGVFELVQLRHPLLDADRVVPNDVHLGRSYHVLVVSGPNAGGKTVAMKAVALATLAAHAGLHVPAAPGARLPVLDALLADIGDAQSLRDSLSTFSAHMESLARTVRAATPRSLVVLDEVGEGTDPVEGAALAQATLEALADAGARVIATTHYNLLKELAAVDSRFENASVEFDPETLAPTYRLRLGAAGVSSATAVAARMGMAQSVLTRANEILDREDRRLERALEELGASRIALEGERREAAMLRAEAEADRSALREKLERLQARRDRLFEGMREELERAFRKAHGEVAHVIRELQRGGSAQQAARARERLLELRSEVEHAQASAEAASGSPPFEAVDWRAARPGDPVRIRDVGTGRLSALPDRHGRAAVQVGAARMLVPADRLGRAEAGSDPPEPRRREAPAAEARGGTRECDLRGLRVDAAVSRLAEELDRAAVEGRRRLVVVHGLGSGALRDAVHAHLEESPYDVDFAFAEPERGGEGVTIVQLSE